MNHQKLVTMLNQIATFHRRKPPEAAATEVAAHIEKFWEPRMRRAAYAHLDAGGEGLLPNAADALHIMQARDLARTSFDPMKDAELEPPLEA